MNEILHGALILLVDDLETNLDVLEIIFSTFNAKTIRANNAHMAIECARKIGREIDLVITDVAMPEMDGIELTSRLRKLVGEHVPIILLTAMAKGTETLERGLHAGANDYLQKPITEVELLARSSSMIRLKKAFDETEALRKTLELRVVERTVELEISLDVITFGLAKLAEYRDPETGAHLERIREYTRTLSARLQNSGPYAHLIDHAFVRNIHKASPLHDIGKVGIPDGILLKPGKLDPDEFEIMNKHSVMGGMVLQEAGERLLTTSSFLTMATEIAFYHHEKWDGTGYPNQLKGENIPLSARIMALADIYDALVSKRIYKEAWPHEKAHQVILQYSGTYLDPAIVDAYRNLEKEFVRIKEDLKD